MWDVDIVIVHPSSCPDPEPPSEPDALLSRVESLQTNSIARASLCARCQSADAGLAGSVNGLRLSMQQLRCVVTCRVAGFSRCGCAHTRTRRIETCCEAVGCSNNAAGSSDSSSSLVGELEPEADLSCVGTMAAVAVLRGPDFCHPDFETFLASNEVL